MSWRIVIEPAYFGDVPGDVAGADEVIVQGASEEDVAEVAHRMAWMLPLFIWTPSRDDPRLVHLLKVLEEDHAQEVLECQIYVKKGSGDKG